VTVAHWDEVESHRRSKGEATRRSPRSNKIYWRGVGVMGRIEQLDYFDGEPVEDD
jgi:hypothetical protein